MNTTTPIHRSAVVSRKYATYDAQNREAATVILGKIERYGGPESGQVRWAKSVMARMEAELATPEVRKNQSELF